MTKKKRKANLNMQRKMESAHHRNVFLGRIRKLCIDYCGEDLLSMLPAKEIDYLYNTRLHSFKVVAGDSSIPVNIIEDAKIFINDLNKERYVVLPSCNMQLSIEEYYTIGATLWSYLTGLEKRPFPKAETILLKSGNLVKDILDIENDARNKITTIYHSFTAVCSSLDRHLYKIEHKFHESNSGIMQNLLTIMRHEAESAMFRIDGHTRPAFRVGWPSSKMQVDWIKLKPLDIGIRYGIFNVETDVYIQTHALIRLCERLDCLYEGLLHFNLYLSLGKPKAINITDQKVLIEYRIFDSKVGYLVARVVDGKILIRTFLFITAPETPEGKKLYEITGLNKLDQNFLAIDKMSSFMTSEISSNKEITEIFENAGLHVLLELYEKFKSFRDNPDKSSPALKLPEYITREQEIYEMPQLTREKIREEIEHR